MQAPPGSPGCDHPLDCTPRRSGSHCRPLTMDAWRRAGYRGLGPDISPTGQGTYISERGTP